MQSYGNSKPVQKRQKRQECNSSSPPRTQGQQRKKRQPLSEWQSRLKNLQARTLQSMVQKYGHIIKQSEVEPHQQLNVDSHLSLVQDNSKCQLVDNAYQRQLPKRMSANHDLKIQNEKQASGGHRNQIQIHGLDSRSSLEGGTLAESVDVLQPQLMDIIVPSQQFTSQNSLHPQNLKSEQSKQLLDRHRFQDKLKNSHKEPHTLWKGKNYNDVKDNQRNSIHVTKAEPLSPKTRRLLDQHRSNQNPHLASSDTRTRFVRAQFNPKLRQKSSGMASQAASTKHSYVSTLASTTAQARTRKQSKPKQNVHFRVHQQAESTNEFKQSTSILPDMFQQFIQLESLYTCQREGGEEEKFKADLIKNRKLQRKARQAKQMAVGSNSNLDLTLQTSAQGGNENDAKREVARDLSLPISHLDNRPSALSQNQNRDTQKCTENDKIDRSPQKIKRQNTEKPSQKQCAYQSSERPDSKWDKTSQKKNLTTLSFPSDFTKRAREIKNNVRASPQKRQKLNNSRSRQNGYLSTPPSIDKTKEHSLHYERKSTQRKKELGSITRSNSSIQRKRRLSPFKNMPNNGNQAGMRHHNRNRRQQIALESRERSKARAAADRILQTDNDMFEKYLKKPVSSSIGFLVLSAKKANERSMSPVFSNDPETYESDLRKRHTQSKGSRREDSRDVCSGALRKRKVVSSKQRQQQIRLINQSQENTQANAELFTIESKEGQPQQRPGNEQQSPINLQLNNFGTYHKLSFWMFS